MAIFKKKTMEEMEAELKRLQGERDLANRAREIASQKRELGKQILSAKVGRATDVVKGMYQGAQKFRNMVAKAYTPESAARVKQMRKVVLNE